MDDYKLTINAFNAMAEAYQERFMDLNLYDKTYDLFASHITASPASILEIGCGPGNITRYLLSKRPDFQILATDAAPNMVALAMVNNPRAQCSVLDCRNIDQLDTSFDGIICGFCMPYLSKEDCKKLISDCSALIVADGILYFSTIEGAYSESGYQTSSNGEHRAFVYYHQEDYLSGYLKNAGFEILNIERISYVKSDNFTQVHLVFISKKLH